MPRSSRMNRMRCQGVNPDVDSSSSSGGSDEDQGTDSEGDISDDCGTEGCDGEIEESDTG